MTPWLHVVGLGEDGLPGLSPAARALVLAAEVLVGGPRHLALAAEAPAPERLPWPSPWDVMEGTLAARRGRRVAVLVSGDPLWFSAGGAIARAFGPEAAFHPHPSAFQLAAARLGWPLEDTACLSIHGRPAARLLAHLAPGARLLLLAAGPASAGEVARLVTEAGWGPSRLVALSHLGGPGEAVREASAQDWAGETPALTTLALEARPAPGTRVLPRWGLPDDAFASDGTMTKRELRALALARLAPRPGETLWDIGTGAGSVAVEWLRAAPGARAWGLEPRADRRAMAAANALALGAPDLALVAGEAPAALADLPDPDAVFLGGGLSEETAETALARLRPHGRLVAHAVTLEGEGVLALLHARHGGDLVRVAVSRAEALGPRRGWRPLMEVTQWAWTRP